MSATPLSPENAALDRLGLNDLRFYHHGNQLGKMGFDQRQFAIGDRQRFWQIDLG